MIRKSRFLAARNQKSADAEVMVAQVLDSTSNDMDEDVTMR